MNNFEMILCIVNAGYSEQVMNVARSKGARGGTIIRARGTANPDAEAYFHIAIQPDKEILMLVVPVDIKDDILHALYNQVGLATSGHGMAFSMPVDDVVGIGGSTPAIKSEIKEDNGEAAK